MTHGDATERPSDELCKAAFSHYFSFKNGHFCVSCTIRVSHHISLSFCLSVFSCYDISQSQPFAWEFLEPVRSVNNQYIINKFCHITNSPTHTRIPKHFYFERCPLTQIKSFWELPTSWSCFLAVSSASSVMPCGCWDRAGIFIGCTVLCTSPPGTLSAMK